MGIKAPRSIDVHREEIFAQLQQANRDAVRPTPDVDDLPGLPHAADEGTLTRQPSACRYVSVVQSSANAST